MCILSKRVPTIHRGMALLNILTRQASKKSDESVVSHVLSMTDRIMKMTDLVQQNMSQAREAEI